MKATMLRQSLWSERLAANAGKAIYHQWEQLELSGCIQNFRIAAGEGEGLREGWFFADSDAYKWLEAAARILSSHPDPRLEALVDPFIALLGRAQQPDGYLFTYNQIHFPGVRWQNLQIEHELYCHGHLIEAGVTHHQATGRTGLLDIACRAADRIVADFRGKGPHFTPGHEEIEIALLRLHQERPGTGGAYLELARQFLDQRGRSRLFALSLARQNGHVAARAKAVEKDRQAYLQSHPETRLYTLPPGNPSPKPPGTTLRWYASVLSGKYFQQHAPLRRQTVPVGHAVRFAYLETAAAMFSRLSGDRSLLPTLERAWERLVTRRMYLTGGAGSLPVLEGFGRDYELDPEFAYAETCAALGNLFWNWEMTLLTGEARYSDCFEWQLYNAALVGMGRDGRSYLYNNPLANHGEVTRRAWYAIPCCPSNLSRALADLGSYVYSSEPGLLRVHQYLSSRLDIGQEPQVTLQVKLESGLPWDGHARLAVLDTASGGAEPCELRLRRPSWAGRMSVEINGQPFETGLPEPAEGREATASGYDPRRAGWLALTRSWSPGDVVDIEFELPLLLRRAHPKVKGHQGKAALTRGPLVYCLESSDNPGTDLFSARLDPGSLGLAFDGDLLGGLVKIEGETTAGTPLTFIPYFLWGNRGPSQMTVWVNL